VEKVFGNWYSCYCGYFGPHYWDTREKDKFRFTKCPECGNRMLMKNHEPGADGCLQVDIGELL
jgi:DNA-directed RNA polymerase subunit RPC12/RpoP